MAEPGEAGEILKRALEYPYATPGHSFLQLGRRTLELPAEGLDLSGRTALLAYGSNAAPAVLARKLAPLPELPLPLFAAELADFDIVYSAHISAYGSVPATLRRSPGTVANAFVAYPTEEQLRLFAATEPNYELTRLGGISCLLETGAQVTELAAYTSRHGCLSIDGAEVALAEIPVRGRGLGEMTQPEVLERVRLQLSPESSLEHFVVACVEAGGIAPLSTLGPL